MALFKPHFGDATGHVALFDTLLATAASLQKSLTNGTLKSAQIVEEYHRAYNKYNGYLNAVYQLAPGAMARAKEMDNLRAQGSVLGPLHGIPIILKDNMDTGPELGMKTTGGTLALTEAEPARNAMIVDMLLDAGMVVLGKATMSELAYFKDSNIRCGWSAVHGQSQSAYVFGGLDMNDSNVGHSSPSGSSSGSAIATSAGLCPVSLGTETFGSLVNPANRASLYTLKPTLGIVPGEGILPISKHFDTAGPIAKTVVDVANLLTVLVDPHKTDIPAGGYSSALGGTWGDIKVGTLDPAVWNSPPHVIKPVKEIDDEIERGTYQAYAKIQSVAKTFHANLTDKTESEFNLDGSSVLLGKLTFGFEHDLDQYLSELHTSPVRSLRELVDWNIEHADHELPPEYPSQDLLVASLNNDHDPEKLEKIEKHMKKVSDEFMKMFDDYDIDVIIGPGDGGLLHFSGGGGFPIASLPVSYVGLNGRPYGLHAATRPHQEALLLKVMSLWEATFAEHQPPKAFLEACKSNL